MVIQKVICGSFSDHFAHCTFNYGGAAARWLGGFGPPSPRGWLARWRAPGKQPKYAAHCTASSHAWYGYGFGFARVGGGGSATFQEHPYLILQVASPSEPPMKIKNTKHRITASDECSPTNALVADVKGLPQIPQSTQLSSIRIYTIHIALYIPRHLSKEEHLRLQLLRDM